ncbi:MAG: hypothetical protein HQ582_03865, partial [Planctomycetes bacterium]|nr:hypothetical protein [Planctomycetota bacterium]
VWDAESVIAYNRVIRALAPVEALVVEGELVGEAVSVDAPGRASGVRRGGEMVLLVADYFRRGDGTLKVDLSLPGDAEIRDLFTGETVIARVPSGKSTVRIELGDARARLLHVRPNAGS